ncbi:MAG TPA: DUF423 domain-containing protein [Longimicrobiales bacterium]|nr:DUF423 domain-containing protein [Longimicrobiales bacterium]
MPSPTDPSSAGRRLFVAGAVLAGLGVALGAFGTHALTPRVPPDRIATWETAVRYHLVHALALLILGLARNRWPVPALDRAGGLILAGTAVFAGSLYLLVLTDTPALGAVTPVGGLLLLAGWTLTAWALGRSDAAPRGAERTGERKDPPPEGR